MAKKSRKSGGTSGSGGSGGNDDLRQRAEERLRQQTARLRKFSKQDREGLAHELSTHQIEIEMQNEELRAAQVELDEAHRRYADLYDFAPVGYLTLDRNGTIIEANHTAGMLLGISKRSLRGRRLAQYVVTPDNAAFSAHIDAVFTKLTRQTCELRLLRVKHGEFHARIESIAALDLGGHALSMRTVLIDITERKRAEEERDRLVAAVESAAEGIVITDTRGLVQYVNPSFERITGYTRDELVGNDLHMLDSGRQDEAFYRQLRETLRSDAIWSGQLVNKRKDGALYHEECTIAPIKNVAGEIINYVYVRRDVTEKLRLESIAEAVNVMENMGYIFSGIRHEMGNPVNSIKMALSVLKANLGAYTGDTIAGYLDRSLGELARIEYLLKNLKSFNLYETPEPQSLEVRPFMEKLLALLKDDFTKKGVSVTLDIAPSVQRCFADPRALQQALLNVFINAADACAGRDPANITVRITVDSGILHLRIADTGQGMTDEQLKNLFKPFRTSKVHGTGLGLVIAKRMLAMMGGAIAVTSRKGEGALVEITLPESMSVAKRP